MHRYLQCLLQFNLDLDKPVGYNFSKDFDKVINKRESIINLIKLRELLDMKAFTPFFVFAIAATLAPSILAKEFLVGDSSGWTINYDYESWVKGKEFHVGDELVFKYPKGVHNVIRVDNATAYEKCLVSTETVALSSGNDVITLTTPGKIWYICGVLRHCSAGEQKIAIEVLPQKLSSGSEPPSPSTTSASKGSSFALTHHQGWMIAIFGILVLIIIV